MWSDRTPPEKLRALVAGLHSVLPAPAPSTSNDSREVPATTAKSWLENGRRHDPGFAWLNGSKCLSCPLVTVSYAAGVAVVNGFGKSVQLQGHGFEILEAMLSAWSGPPSALLAGYLSYDLAAELEDLGELPAAGFSFPSFYFGLYDSTVTLDQGHWTVASTNAWSQAIMDLDIKQGKNAEKDETAAARQRMIPQFSPLTSTPDRAAFERAVERTVQTIHAGDIFKTNLCRSVETSLEPGTEWELFQRLRSISPARYEAFLRIDPQRVVFSISPEQFLRLDHGVVESSPIKGTRPRGKTAEEDRALSEKLQASEKDRAELAMIVDVVRNDLSRVCETGSVKVEKHADLMTLPTVHHLFSRVTGRLRQDQGPVDLLRAAFPAASISGAPKIEAMRVAIREEGQLRGPCMGAIGWISMDGRMEFSVAIRTAFVTGGRVRYYGGCGITADSVPADEFVESQHKISAFVRALGREDDPNW